jgi:nitrogen fixation NifU-like protein
MTEEEFRDHCQQVILDHSRRPRNFGDLADASHRAEGANPLCGDRVRVFLRVADGRILAAAFDGSGCAISRASASLLTGLVMGRTTEEAGALFERTRRLVATGEVDEPELDPLGIFAGLHRFPVRAKCALLPWFTLRAALRGEAEPVTTE